MTEEKIARINELARLAKMRELTADEQKERQELRQEYIDSFRRSLETQLGSIVVQEEDGSRHKLHKKQ